MNPLHLCEAYAAVYDEDLREEIVDDQMEEIDIISELHDEELDEIVEETIIDLLDEGYEIEDIEEIFEEVLSEARVDMAARAARRKTQQSEREKSAKEARSRGAAYDREQKRKETIERVKGAVKSKVAQVKDASGKAAKAVQKKVKDVKQQSHVGLAKYASDRKLMPGAGLKTQSSKGRSQLRSAVLGDVASRAKSKLGRGVEKVKSAAQGAASRAKSSAKSAVGKAARSVATGASKVATRLGEEVETVDLYDVVLEHLLDEGYADTAEAATVIMANMSEEWREEILESRGNPESPSLHKLTRGKKKEKGVKSLTDNQGKFIRGPYHDQLKKRGLPPYNR